MSVTFSDEIQVFTYPSCYQERETDACDRWRIERGSLLQSPSTEFHRVRHTFEMCRAHKVTILFGNLGRNPLLVTYFLDLIFSHCETVGIQTPWPWKTPYRARKEPLDYVFCVEPCFGFSISPVHHAKHLIVLTSHLSLRWPGRSYVAPLFVGEPIRQLPSALETVKGPLIRPPLYHSQDSVRTLPEQVVLDVSRARSAHEAYLRVLTGRELARRTTRYACQMTQRNVDMIRFHVDKIRREADARRDEWKDPTTTAWIREGFLKGWESIAVVDHHLT